MKIKMNKKDEKFTLDELFERYQKQSKIRNLDLVNQVRWIKRCLTRQFKAM